MKECDFPEDCRSLNGLSQIIAAYDELLTDICNEYMEVDGDGSFSSSDGLANRANALLGI